jgi:hypothetical protein
MRGLAVLSVVSGTASLVIARLANPLAVDDALSAFVLFFLIPGVSIIIAGGISRVAGTALAAAWPAVWLVVVTEASDGPMLWLACAAGIASVLSVAFLVRRGTPVIRVVGATAVAGAVLFLVPVLTAGPERPKLTIVGIDGATWDRIDPLIAQGRMPNLERLIEGGVRSDLRSLDSMYSPQVWTTIATGCLPEDHGIWDFGNTQSDLQVGRIWDRMRLDGRSSGTCGWYFTWPPPEDPGPGDFVIPSMLAPDSSTCPDGYSFYWQLWAREHPRRKETVPYWSVALRAFRHGVRLSTLRRAVMEIAVWRRLHEPTLFSSSWRDRCLSVDLQSDMFCELVRTRRPELAAILISEVDKVSHLYWKFMEPEGFPDVTEEERELFSEAVNTLYEKADGNLGKIMSVLPRDGHVLVVSDHGFQPSHSKIAGGYCRVRTENLLQTLGCSETVVGTNVDSRVYLRPVHESYGERELIVERLTAVLRSATLSGETGPFFRVERDGEALVIEVAPRDAIPEGAVLLFGEESHRVEELLSLRLEARFSGEHHPVGVFVLSGPSAGTAAAPGSLSVLDVAPTAAAILGLPLSPGWRGRPLLGAGSDTVFTYADYPPPSALASKQPSVLDESLKEKLRAMGYLE